MNANWLYKLTPRGAFYQTHIDNRGYGEQEWQDPGNISKIEHGNGPENDFLKIEHGNGPEDEYLKIAHGNGPDGSGRIYKQQIVPFKIHNPDTDQPIAKRSQHLLPVPEKGLHSWMIFKHGRGTFTNDDTAKKIQTDLRSSLQKDAPAPASTSHIKDARCIVFFHGVDSNIRHPVRLAIYSTLLNKLCQSGQLLLLLAVDYRGFGFNKGNPSESGLIEDGIAAVNVFLHRLDIDSRRIMLVAHSLGSAVALATFEHFRNHQRTVFGGLVISGPFTHAHDAIANKIAQRQWGWQHAFADTWDNLRRMRLIMTEGADCPVVIAHAGDDDATLASGSVKLYLAAREAGGVENEKGSLTLEEQRCERGKIFTGRETFTRSTTIHGNEVTLIINWNGGHQHNVNDPRVVKKIEELYVKM